MKQLGVFAKYWQPGKVKTRLGQSIGLPQAADLYRRFLEATIRRSRSETRLHSSWGSVLFYSPAETKPQFQTFLTDVEATDWKLFAQSEGDLGARMDHYFRSSFERGMEQVLLIGSDCPHFRPSVFSEAFRALEESDLVFGPAEDGGYYLIGMNSPCPEIFSGVQWSTDSVLQQSLLKAQKAGKKVALLGSQYDLDDLDSLKQFVNDPVVGSCPDLVVLKQQIEKIL